MAEVDPDAPTKLTFASYWQPHIDNACAGDAIAKRNVMQACIEFLNGSGFIEPDGDRAPGTPFDPRGSTPKGYVPEPLCTFLLETLETAMSVPTKEVGNAMGMGNPARGRRNKKALDEFIKRYISQVDDCYPVTKKQHVEALWAIKKQMGCEIRTIQRYWKHFEPGIKKHGLPSIEDYSEVYKLEELHKILCRYRSQMCAPLHNNSLTPADAHEEYLIEVASYTGMRLSSVKHYWEVFETALADYDWLPLQDSRNRTKFEDIVTVINHYVSIMNSLAVNDDFIPGVEYENILEKIEPLMNKDSDSVWIYWEIVLNTIRDS
jgi:hypothetical protein